ncbi:Zinc transporter ZIP9 [Coccomyxa sp. Obi]|nr:Zinc transporter ZIP9 [Coccomyxa sp. Obi]
MALSTIEHLGITCVVMFLAAMGSGMLPLLIQISEGKLAVMGALGAGLLVGTALSVIIPEGFHAFQSAQQETGVDLADWAIGAVLVAGFLAMLLLDHLQQVMVGGSPAHAHAHVHHSSSSQSVHRQHCHCSDEDPEDDRTCAQKAQSEAASRALVGLLVHSAADGFAVGASSVSTSASLSFLVAVAMVLHKAPVAFGLATYLLSARWAWARARRALLLFAAASPLTAIATYILINAAPVLSSQTSIALCVLFSGGTFLYAACIHILPEIMGDKGKLTRSELAAVVGGSLVPILFSALQGDHHH